jgi:hypothetical protein
MVYRQPWPVPHTYAASHTHQPVVAQVLQSAHQTERKERGRDAGKKHLVYSIEECTFCPLYVNVCVGVRSCLVAQSASFDCADRSLAPELVFQGFLLHDRFLFDTLIGPQAGIPQVMLPNGVQHMYHPQHQQHFLMPTGKDT